MCNGWVKLMLITNENATECRICIKYVTNTIAIRLEAALKITITKISKQTD